VLYLAAFDVIKENTLHGFGTITLTTAGETDVVVDLANITGTGADNVSGATTFWVYSSGEKYCVDQSRHAQTRFPRIAKSTWAKAVDTALKLEAVAEGWTTKVPACTFSLTTGLYTFSVATVNSAIAWSTTGGRELFGFAGNSSSAASHVGTLTPLFVISPTQAAISVVSESALNYEPSGIGNRITTDSGSGHGLARRVSPLYRDWQQEYETKEKTMRLQAAAAHPWTFQDLFEHCRGMFPFVVYDGGFHTTEDAGEVFTFRTDGIPFAAEPATLANHAQLHLAFRCIVEGTLTTVPA
jgi:hypothetical protein